MTDEHDFSVARRKAAGTLRGASRAARASDHRALAMGDDDASQTLAEMTANLAEYKEQLEQVRPPPPLCPLFLRRPRGPRADRRWSPRPANVLTRPRPRSRPLDAQVDLLLAAEPANAEYMDVKASLVEVIAMTEDLVAGHPETASGLVTDEAKAIDQSVAGAPCQVRMEGTESTWLDAVMVAVLSDGRIRVVATKPGVDEETEEVVADVAPDDVRDAAAGAKSKPEEDDGCVRGEDDFDIALGEDGNVSGVTRESTETYRGVPAPKRLRVAERVSFEKRPVPESLKVRDGDDEATRERKRKQVKAFKGKQRMMEKDAEQTSKKNDWQSFQAKVGGKKKVGFMSKKIGNKKTSSVFGSKD
jgi:survival-of-motor-neuron-related-splicing factor 30